jgi:hypothetical protein
MKRNNFVALAAVFALMTLAAPSQASELLMTCSGDITYKDVEEEVGAFEVSFETDFEGLEIRQDDDFVFAVHTQGPGRGAEVTRLEDCHVESGSEWTYVQCERLIWHQSGTWRAEYLIAQKGLYGEQEFEIMVLDQSPERVPFLSQALFTGVCE